VNEPWLRHAIQDLLLGASQTCAYLQLEADNCCMDEMSHELIVR